MFIVMFQTGGPSILAGIVALYIHSSYPRSMLALIAWYMYALLATTSWREIGKPECKLIVFDAEIIE